jgi:hypothetical protein
LRGPFALDEIGVLISVATPLARANISVMTIATYDTDYILVPGHLVENAVSAIVAAGHTLTVRVSNWSA